MKSRRGRGRGRGGGRSKREPPQQQGERQNVTSSSTESIEDKAATTPSLSEQATMTSRGDEIEGSSIVIPGLSPYQQLIQHHHQQQMLAPLGLAQLPYLPMNSLMGGALQASALGGFQAAAGMPLSGMDAALGFGNLANLGGGIGDIGMMSMMPPFGGGRAEDLLAPQLGNQQNAALGIGSTYRSLLNNDSIEATNQLLQLQRLQTAQAALLPMERFEIDNAAAAAPDDDAAPGTAASHPSLSTWVDNKSGEGDPYAEHGILGPWSATSAGLLGSMAMSSTIQKTKKVRKKSKDKPKRPLSAYNVFFKEERTRLMEEKPGSGGGGKKKKVASAAARKQSDSSETDQEKVKTKTKGPGKIGFESLAKVIGHRWQELTPDQVEYYKMKADEDMLRYKQEMETYNAANKTKAKSKSDTRKRSKESERSTNETKQQQQHEEDQKEPSEADNEDGTHETQPNKKQRIDAGTKS